MNLSKRKAEFGGGWSQVATVDGRQYWLILKRGRYLGRKYGNRCFQWTAFVYLDGRQVWSSTAGKGISAREMLRRAEVIS